VLEVTQVEGSDLIVVGPGPGDPTDVSDPKIARLHAITRDLLHGRTPFLGVCLGHQVLADELGLQLIRRESPNQVCSDGSGYSAVGSGWWIAQEFSRG